jgi:hypothetical protein
MNENAQRILTIDAVIAAGRNNLPNDEQRNAEMVAEHIRLDVRPHGCVLDKNVRHRPSEPVWKTVVFIGGAQRVVARGTLYQCARAYDAALLRWSAYRTRHHVDFSKPSSFNFDKEQAGRDVIHGDFVNHFGALEECWQRDGIVLQPAEEPSSIRSTDRQMLERIEAKLDEQIALLHKVSETLHLHFNPSPNPSAQYAEPTAPVSEESFNGTAAPDTEPTIFAP